MRIMAYDPSLVNLGYAYGTIINGSLVVERSGTFQPDKFLKATGLFDTGDVTTDRQLAVEHFITIGLSQYRPEALLIESSFYNGVNPATIINQSKGLGLIEKLLFSYLRDIHSPFELVKLSPNVIKRDLGLSKEEFSDKTAIDTHIYRRIDEGKIEYTDATCLPKEQLDHANDAVAMLYCLATRMLSLQLIEIKEDA